MAKSINQVTLLGNLTRDPEYKELPTGGKVATFSLALNRSFQDKDKNWQEATDYVDVVVWGLLAEQVSQRLYKGNRALVNGRIQTRSWEQEGIKRNKIEVLASDVVVAEREPINNKSTDVVLTDIEDKPIDLSEIPF